MSARVIVSCALLLAAPALAACSSPLPAPPTVDVSHDDTEPYWIVPFPPPPGRVEIIPPVPPTLKHAVWMDGEWLWKGQRWVWKQGRWEDPPPDQKYALPKTTFLGDGSIIHFAGTWKPAKKVETPATASAATPPAPPAAK